MQSGQLGTQEMSVSCGDMSVHLNHRLMSVSVLPVEPLEMSWCFSQSKIVTQRVHLNLDHIFQRMLREGRLSISLHECIPQVWDAASVSTEETLFFFVMYQIIQ